MVRAGAKRPRRALERRGLGLCLPRAARLPAGSFDVQEQMKLRKQEAPYLSVLGKAVDNFYFLGPVCQIVLLDVSQ